MSGQRLVARLRASAAETLMSGAISAQQYQAGGRIAIVYTDGSVEIGESRGKLLTSEEQFPNFFSVLRHVQDQRPKTTMTVPENLGPQTMSEEVAL